MEARTGADDQEDVFAFLTQLADAKARNGAPRRIDTHANVVFLIGPKAVKVKRAVKFPFLDYSTLDKRAEACRSEISHNIENAPQIYEKAVAILRQEDGSLCFASDAIDGGDVVEWAVIMNRFDLSGQLDHIAAKGPLPPDLSEALAAMLFKAHAQASRRPEASQTFVNELSSYIDQNEAAFADHADLFPPQKAEQLIQMSRSALSRIAPVILSRGARGHVRLCHGDAHMRNIVLIDGVPVLFDAIEFSDAMATTDTLYDLAFLLMDLWEQDQHAAANRIFNRYLDRAPLADPAREEATGADEEALVALPFYLMMRAAIRAKIAASAAQSQQDAVLREEQRTQARTYFGHALRFLDPSEPMLLAIGGLSGTGKTTLAHALAPDFGRAPGARIFRTDVLRKRLLGLDEFDPAPASAYTRQASDTVYALIDAKIAAALASGHSAIFDAVFAAENERLHIEEVAGKVEARFAGLWLHAPLATLKDRVSKRVGDASDATADIVERQSGYGLGTLTWTQVDASAGPAETAAAARRLLAPLTAQKP